MLKKVHINVTMPGTMAGSPANVKLNPDNKG
jgi:hypothetical protein